MASSDWDGAPVRGPESLEAQREAVFGVDAMVQLRNGILYPDHVFTPVDPTPLLDLLGEALAGEPVGPLEAELAHSSRIQPHWPGIRVEDPFRVREWRTLSDVPYLARSVPPTETARVKGLYVRYHTRNRDSGRRTGTYAAPGLQDLLLDLLEADGYTHMEDVRHDTLWFPGQVCRRPVPQGADPSSCTRCALA